MESDAFRRVQQTWRVLRSSRSSLPCTCTPPRAPRAVAAAEVAVVRRGGSSGGLSDPLSQSGALTDLDFYVFGGGMIYVAVDRLLFAVGRAWPGVVGSSRGDRPFAPPRAPQAARQCTAAGRSSSAAVANGVGAGRARARAGRRRPKVQSPTEGPAAWPPAWPAAWPRRRSLASRQACGWTSVALRVEVEGAPGHAVECQLGTCRGGPPPAAPSPAVVWRRERGQRGQRGCRGGCLFARDSRGTFLRVRPAPPSADGQLHVRAAAAAAGRGRRGAHAAGGVCDNMIPSSETTAWGSPCPDTAAVHGTHSSSAHRAAQLCAVGHRPRRNAPPRVPRCGPADSRAQRAAAERSGVERPQTAG